jgi:hypothetical protein
LLQHPERSRPRLRYPITDAPSSSGADRRERELAAEVAQLKSKLAKKDGVIAEISAEYVQLKKALGEP